MGVVCLKNHSKPSDRNAHFTRAHIRVVYNSVSEPMIKFSTIFVSMIICLFTVRSSRIEEHLNLLVMLCIRGGFVVLHS